MNCPICKTVSLVMSERQGIEIDYCPQCRGVWLDRGELDKIIDRSATAAPAPRPEASPAPFAGQPAPSHQSHQHQSHQSHPYPSQQPQQSHPASAPQGGYYKKKKREGFLSDLFDFD